MSESSMLLPSETEQHERARECVRLYVCGVCVKERERERERDVQRCRRLLRASPPHAHAHTCTHPREALPKSITTEKVDGAGGSVKRALASLRHIAMNNVESSTLHRR
jgi:hypothetical protein